MRVEFSVSEMLKFVNTVAMIVCQSKLGSMAEEWPYRANVSY